MKFMPGDELRIDCTYNSSQKSVATHYGESTSDEMCFGFISYYPADDNFTQCTQWRSAEVCSNVPVNCGLNDFNALAAIVGKVCNPVNCSHTCQQVIRTLVDTGCMTGDVGIFLAHFSSDPARFARLAQMASTCNVTMAIAVWRNHERTYSDQQGQILQGQIFIHRHCGRWDIRDLFRSMSLSDIGCAWNATCYNARWTLSYVVRYSNGV